jgi:hypothetical protein
MSSHFFTPPLVLLALVALSYAFIAAEITVSRICCAESGRSVEVSYMDRARAYPDW